ncbi:protein cordon-bleu [Ahaetulla prasina]|uniref:protein cordon-bleu n=1 Tax=Ahaetulla prasina TaxID=499056 RepID=UPI0026481114|nr:protein cordon-bleu [Ahaetulla prasina]
METGATQSGDYKPASGQKIKGRAPQPPFVRDVNEHKVIPTLETWSDQNILTMKGNLIKTTLDILVVLPNGEEQKITVHGSKPVMDLFVELCSQYHLNPAHHTFELKSGEPQESVNYKPNTLIGTLDVQKVLLKLKVPEEKKIKRPPPQIPEKTVRLVVNYLKAQKTVVRVNPEVPLRNIVPIICEKCEVSQECIVLLRDTFTGEKLELSKSLNDLGIKELYAWNNRRVLPAKTHSEPVVNYRETKVSPGYDTSVKEKKGLFGYFRTSKKNKAETSSRRSLDLGSGEYLKSILYRKQSLDEAAIVDSSRNLCSALPAPSLSLGNIQGATSSTVMKKRRAPPRPVISSFPGGEADREEKMPTRMSQSSLQLEVKKQKRRAPLPPPPKIPTRYNELQNKRESTIGNEQQVPQKPPRGNTRDPPQLVLPPPPSYPPPDKASMDSAALYHEADVTDPTQLVSKRNVQLSHTYKEDTVEETSFFSSCSMPKCKIDDTEIINLPPVIVPMAFPTDGINSTDKSIDVEKTSAEIDSVLVAKECSVNNATFKNDKSEIIKQRADGRMVEAKIENIDIASIQNVQLAADKSLAGAENIHNDSKSQSVFFEMKGASSPLLQKAENPSDVSSPVPVTIIDEVPKNYTIAHSNTEEKELFSKTEPNENIPVKLADLIKFFNRNTNIESASKECVGTSSYSSKNLSQKNSTGSIYEDTSDELNKSHLELKGASAKNPDEEESDSTQFPWRRHLSNRCKINRSKTGLTTFTVVPPKPKIRNINKIQSLYTGGIQIDDLGNLVKPNNGSPGKITVDATSKVTSFGRGKEYKRSNSMGKQTEELPLDQSVEAKSNINDKQPNKTSRTKPDCIRSLKTETWPIVDSSDETTVGSDEIKVPSNTSQFLGKTVLASAIVHMAPKQSSNDYLATTVANSNDLMQLKTIQGKQYEELNKTEGMKTEMDLFSKRCTVAAKYCPVELEPAKTKELYSTTFSFSKNVSNTTPSCADRRVSNIKTSEQNKTEQNKATNTTSGTFTTLTSNKNNLLEQEFVYDLVKDVTDREMTFAVIKKPSDQVRDPLFLSTPSTDTSATTFSSHVKSSDIPSIAMVSQTKYEDLGEAESKLCPNRIEDNIYNIFGTKTKIKSVVQKPPPKETSLHSTLMEAIRNAGGKYKLRKSTISESPKESKFMETKTERSALLAAIRGHSGVSMLRKISSFASEELQKFRNADIFKNKNNSAKQQQYGLPLALSPAQLRMRQYYPGMKDSVWNSRQALMEDLMETINAGTGKACLRKVPQSEKSYNSETL